MVAPGMTLRDPGLLTGRLYGTVPVGRGACEEGVAGGVEVAVEGEEFAVEGGERLVRLEGFADGDEGSGVCEGGEGAGCEVAEEGSA